MKKTQTKPTGRYVLLACFIGMLVFNFMTPMSADDFAHYYSIDGAGHIDSPALILSNLSYLRQNVNGRVFSHFLVYLMQIPPRAVFRVVNAAVLPLLLWLMSRFLKDRARAGALWFTAGAFLLWIFAPAFGETFLWLTGSCNYGWGLLLFLLLLRPFYARAVCGDDGIRGIGMIPLCLLAFLGGAYSESGGIALLCAEFGFLVMTLLWEKRCPGKELLLFLLGCAGFLFLLQAPATMATRTGDLSLHGLAVGMKSVVGWLRQNILWLYLLYALLFALLLVRGGDRRVLSGSLILVASGLVSGLALAAASNIPARSFFALGCFTVLACLILLAELNDGEDRTLKAALAAALTVVFLFDFASGAGDILSLFLQGRSRASQIRAAHENGETVITLREYAVSTKYGEVADEGLQEDPDYWYNNLLAVYYGFDRVVGEVPYD